MSAEYFALPAVNNSDLHSLKRAMRDLGDLEDMQEIFNFGNLVDAMLTENGRVNHRDMTLTEGNKIIEFCRKDFELATSMYRKAIVDPVVQGFLKGGQHQHIFVKILAFEFDGEWYSIQGKCKFDTIKKSISTGADYKTTSCSTRKGCEASIEHFGYDQAAAWYMDLAGIDRHWLIFISKKTKEVFKFAIQRGDATYLRGRAKYSFWAYMWVTLVDKF